MGGTIDGAGLRLTREHRILLGRWVLVLLPVAVVFALCFRPVMRLRGQPPPDFIETHEEWDALTQSEEDRTGRAYWQIAINTVQWRFAFGSELPAEPLEDFRLNDRDFARSSAASAPATRRKYWNRLRRVWSQPQAWHETYVWNTEWLRESLSKVMDYFFQLPDRILK